MMVDLHIFFVFASGAAVLYSDEQGFFWMRGTRATLSQENLEWLHALVGIGLAGLVATGGLLFLRAPHFYLSDPIFLVKIVFVAALLINGFFIGQFTKIAAHKEWKSLTPQERLPLMVSGVVSAVSWASAVICGLLLG